MDDLWEGGTLIRSMGPRDNEMYVTNLKSLPQSTNGGITHLRVDDEDIAVVYKHAVHVSVIRGAYGSVPSKHDTGAAVRLLLVSPQWPLI